MTATVTPVPPPSTTTAPAPPRGYREALTRLRTAQKRTPGAPGYSRFVNRKLGRLIAAGAYVLNRTPNQVTAVSALFSFSGIAVLALFPRTGVVAAVVCACLVVGYAFDAADGQLARLRGGGSRTGEWLDHMVDAVKVAALHLAVLVSLFRFDPPEHLAWLLVPIVFAGTATSWFFGIILVDQIRRTDGRQAAGTGPSPLRALLVLPSDYGVICLLFGLLATGAFLPVYTAVAAFNLLFFVASLVRWYGELTRADAAAATHES
ncbi:MAG: hypothetical protein QOJ32_713 [Frankiaceae bacterium]|nr:hypothetical protein [Frankiaceae bacterium]